MIKLIKLISGDTMIGDYEDGEDCVILHEPMIVNIYKTSPEESTLGLHYALTLSSDTYLVFQKRNIITAYNPTDILKEYYMETIKTVNYDREYSDEVIEDSLLFLKVSEDDRSELNKKILEMVPASNTTIH
jgi:hypothetical protein